MTSHERAVEVDEALAALWEAQNEAEANVARAIESLHRDDGQQQDWRRQRRSWDVSDEDTEASVRAKLADQTSPFWYTLQPEGRTILIHTGQYATNHLELLDEARRAIVEARRAAEPLEEEYAANRWSRFFLVQNTGGHVHSSMHCSTTFPTTQWAWLPQLSGLTEDAAVADQGPRLCSVCYPSAPVEWTLGLPKAPRCPGSGKSPAPGRERYTSQPCSVCGKSYPVSRNTGLVRAHKPQEGLA